MADYARTLAAVDQVLGTAGLTRYMGAQARMASEALTGDLFITAIAAKLADRDFAGTAAELLSLVTPADDTWRPPKGWPANPRAVTQRLHRQAPVMRKAGWLVSDDGAENKQHATRWQISTPEKAPYRPSPSSPSSPDQDETDTQARKARKASNDSDLPTRTCTVCGNPLDPVLASLGGTAHPQGAPRQRVHHLPRAHHHRPAHRPAHQPARLVPRPVRAARRPHPGRRPSRTVNRTERDQSNRRCSDQRLWRLRSRQNYLRHAHDVFLGDPGHSALRNGA